MTYPNTGTALPPGGGAGGATSSNSITWPDPGDASPVIINNNFPEGTPPQGRYFSEEDITKARQQEKDKLYPQLEALRTQVESLAADKEAREAAARKAQEDADAAVKAAAEAEMTATQKLEARMAEIAEEARKTREEVAVQQALIAKEKEFLQIQSYRDRKIAELTAQDGIIPDLAEFIDGNTIEEIDRAANSVIEKSARILEGMQGNSGNGTPPVPTPGVSTNGFIPSSPLDQFQQQGRQPTPEEIAGMDMETYRANRDRLGVNRSGYEGGMFR